MSQKPVLEIYLECFTNNSEKYYAFRLIEDKCYIHYARIGKQGMLTLFSDAADIRAIKKQLESKLKKGYKIERITNVDISNSRLNLLDLAMQQIANFNGSPVTQDPEPDPVVIDLSQVVFQKGVVCPVW
jgi:predicted DNA-binding WGR domain protein